MNRRALLRLLASGTFGTIANHELDLDRLLWVPRAKTICLPPPPVVFARGDIITIGIAIRFLKHYSIMTDLSPGSGRTLRG